MRIETFEQLINFGAGRKFSVSKATNAKPETVISHKQITMNLSPKAQTISSQINPKTKLGDLRVIAKEIKKDYK